MKRLGRFSLLLLLAASPAFSSLARSEKKKLEKIDRLFDDIRDLQQKHKRACRKKVDCSKGTRFICQKNVGTEGLIITKPGEYCLIEDIFFAPSTDTTHAITIAASNVSINLNGRKIIQVNDNKNNIGIFVIPGVSVVEISNGIIENLGAFGIWVSNGVDTVLINNVNFSACGSRGHGPYAIVDTFQPNGLAFFAGSIGLGGKGSLEDPTARIAHVSIFDCKFINTVNPENVAFDPVSGQNISVIATGIVGTSLLRASLERNFASTIVSEQNTARGITLTNASSVNINHNQIEQIIHFQGATGILLDQINGALINDCAVDQVEDRGGVNLIQRGSIGIGIFSSSEVILENSTVTRVTNTSATGIAHGVDIRNTVGSLVSNTNVAGCTGINEAASVIGISYTPVIPIDVEKIKALNVEKGTAITDCKSTDNTSSNGTAYGIAIQPLQTQISPISPIVDSGIPRAVVVENCTATGNTTAGIWLRDAAACTVTESIIKNNGHFGILLDQTALSIPAACSIEKNIIETNGVSGLDAGVRDNYGTIKNMYTGNQAFNNRPVNYAGIPATTALVTWNIPATPQAGDVSHTFANLDAVSN